jgi:aspartyl-tRNA(Asn)/glutamyl-tRNA(Gln) amidotransferase subunit B
MKWETVIGLEIHVQLQTQSKLFSGAATAYGAAPNSQACAIDLALPGVLPVLNREAVMMAVKFGLAVNAQIAKRSIFARKNYFYPDLPKGYQISQYEIPIVGKGSIVIELENGESKRIGITRAHLEEDAGKSVHEDFHGSTGIDLNRAGTPLLEIVSEPDLRSAKEAMAYAKKIHTLVRYLTISDGNMQEGSFRCDVNLSLRPEGQQRLGTRAELKNLNSFRFLEKAVHYEFERQRALLESGRQVVQETRLYDPDKNETRSMRTKEDANDYRYFPDPDLLPVVVDEALITRLKTELPELPDSKKDRFMRDYKLSAYDAEILTSSKEMAEYFEQTLQQCNDARLASNWVSGELQAALNKSGLDIRQSPIGTQQLGNLLMRISDKTISGRAAKEIFEAVWQGEGEVDAIIQAKNLSQESDTTIISQWVSEVIADNPDQVAQYRGGKGKVIGFFVGKIMQMSKGKADPAQVNALLKEKLKNG